MQTSKSQFAAQNHLTPDAAYLLLSYLVAIGIAKNIGMVPKAPGAKKGRSETLYELDADRAREHFARFDKIFRP
jgi:hypothetical protein